MEAKKSKKELEEIKLFFRDENRRVYIKNGVTKNSPYEEFYFRPIEIVDETEKEFICSLGSINKKSMLYYRGGKRFKVYTETEKDDNVYVAENRHLIAEMVRKLNADQLKQVAIIINYKD